MSIELQRTFSISTTVDRVARALCSEAYAMESAEIREDVASATHRVISRDETRVEYEVAYVEYARSRTGKLDKGQTVNARTIHVLDLERNPFFRQHDADPVAEGTHGPGVEGHHGTSHHHVYSPVELSRGTGRRHGLDMASASSRDPSHVHDHVPGTMASKDTPTRHV